MSIQGTPVAGIRWLVDSDGAVVGYRNPVTDQDAAADFGSGSGSGSNYLGQAASEAAMTALQAAVGSECLRTDVGTGLMYELKALPATTAANWQPLQGVIPDATLITISLVDGKLPRQLLVWVAAATEVTVSDGTTSYILIPSSYPHVIAIFDDPTAAAPTAITIQRTAGTATTGRYSLERA